MDSRERLYSAYFAGYGLAWAVEFIVPAAFFGLADADEAQTIHKAS
jgi:hypothetical protein